MSSEDTGVDISEHVAESVSPSVDASMQMIPQHVMNAKVGGLKDELKAAQLAKQELEAKLAQMQQAQSPQGNVQSSGGIDESAIVQKAIAAMNEKIEAQKQAAIDAEHAKRLQELAQQYNEKMSQGTQMYEDFEATVGRVNPNKFSHAIVLAAQVDNVPQVMYDLAKNPLKLAQINALAQQDPQLAREELAKLSESIKNNEAALKNSPRAQSPLKQLKTSTIAGSDNGKRSIKDMRADPRYRV